jgi:hypothetical protein
MSTYTIRIEDTDDNTNVRVSLEFDEAGMNTESPAFSLAAFAMEAIASLDEEETQVH